MTTDDLRTRARDVLRTECDLADRDLRKWVRVPVKHVRALLAHAAQQPSLPHRDELAAVIMDATVPFRGPGGQTVPYVQPVHYAMADAVLALLTGDESDE